DAKPGGQGQAGPGGARQRGAGGAQGAGRVDGLADQGHRQDPGREDVARDVEVPDLAADAPGGMNADQERDGQEGDDRNRHGRTGWSRPVAGSSRAGQDAGRARRAGEITPPVSTTLDDLDPPRATPATPIIGEGAPRGQGKPAVLAPGRGSSTTTAREEIAGPGACLGSRSPSPRPATRSSST